MIEYKFTGGVELQKALNTLSQTAERKAAIMALRAGGRVVIKEAKKLAPVDSGKLKKGFTTKALPKKSGVIGLLVGIKGGKNAPFYASMVEFGTKFKPARPFFRPAFDNKQPEIMKAVIEKLQTVILKGLK